MKNTTNKKTASAVILCVMAAFTAALACRLALQPENFIQRHDPAFYASRVSEFETLGAAGDDSGKSGAVDGSSGKLGAAGNDAGKSGAVDGSSGKLGAAGNDAGTAARNTAVPASGSLNTLTNAKMEITTNRVAEGENLQAAAVVTGLKGNVICKAVWYYDGEAFSTLECLILRNGSAICAEKEIEYTRDMKLDHNVGLELTCDELSGDPDQYYVQESFTIKNYSKYYYDRMEAADAIVNAKGPEDVTSVYKGGGLSSYNVDYPEEVKTAFVNSKGYSSKTEYLAWVSLSTQKVNIFQGSKGCWSLIHTYRCATGARSSPTPTGVTYVTRKQAAWVTPDYTVKYVTRFYPGSGYAFHSILYKPSGSGIQSGAMGYPTSHGCVRTEDEGVRWIYENLSIGSTVVIF